ncbi:MAG: yajC [Acidimicrobiales bacterium]|nr:yajC [Acidimicrobiales bacterium]
MQYLIFVFLIPAFWLMLVRPQQRQRRTHQAVVASLAVGQRVMTVGGLIGTLTRVDAETVALDVGDGTELTFARSFIRQQIDDEAEAGASHATGHDVEEHVELTERTDDRPDGLDGTDGHAEGAA